MKIKPINPIAKMVAYARRHFTTKIVKPKKGKGSYVRPKSKKNLQN